jgi:SPP1 gp7 family putative phage head morphogenesis protein
MVIDQEFSLPMRGAQAFWRDKVQVEPEVFKAIADEAKGRAFAVSGIAKGDELNTVFQALQRAIDNGTTFEDFQDECVETFARRGWNGKNPWRVANIFSTNIQTAYNVGRYDQLQQEKDILPYWMYDAINDGVVRPTHRDMDGRVYPVDHPIWNSWYPPNGYGCRCSVSGLTREQVTSRGLDVATENSATGETELVNTGTGAVREVSPVSPDVGFDSNPGKDWWQQTDKIIRERLKTYPPELASLVEAELGGLLDEKTP